MYLLRECKAYVMIKRDTRSYVAPSLVDDAGDVKADKIKTKHLVWDQPVKDGRQCDMGKLRGFPCRGQ